MIHYMEERQLVQFQKTLLEEEKSLRTMEKYLRDLRDFLRYAKEQGRTADGAPSGQSAALPPVLVDKELVIRYKAGLMERYKVTSVNSMLAALNHFFKE